MKLTMLFFVQFVKGLVCIFVCFCISLYHFDFVLPVLLNLLFSVPNQDIGWEERLRSDLFCVEWDVLAPYFCLFAMPGIVSDGQIAPERALGDIIAA